MMRWKNILWRLRDVIRLFRTRQSFITHVLIALIIAALIAIIIVLFSLRQRPVVTIPEIMGDELAVALLKLQERDLVPIIRLEFDDDIARRGTVLRQKPSAGRSVRIGKRVEVAISRGSAGYSMENLVGKTFDEVQQIILEYGSNYDANLQIDAINYAHNEAPRGTIIAQSPAAGMDIDLFALIDLVVSLGPEETPAVIVPNLLGTTYKVALDILIDREIPFIFDTVPASDTSDTSNDYHVVDHQPRADSVIADDNPVTVTIQEAATPPLGLRFGIYTFQPPELTSATDTRAIALLDDGSIETLAEYSLRHPRVSIPYLLPPGSIIQLFINDDLTDELIVQ